MRYKLYKRDDGKFDLIAKATRPSEHGTVIQSAIAQKDLEPAIAQALDELRSRRQSVLPALSPTIT